MSDADSYGWMTVGEEERERLLTDQLPQVRYIARRIHERLPQHVPFDDLVHAGVLGLIDALQKFDPLKHVQFQSYAKHRIRGAILDSLRELDWSPRELRRKARLIEQANIKLGTMLGRSATEQEIATELGMDLKSFHILLRDLDGLELTSLQLESPQEGREEDVCEFVPSAAEESPFHLCLQGEMKQLLSKAISELPEKERQVLALYYYEELTMKEVGAVIGVGESRVSQIHSLAVARLRSRVQELLQGRPPTSAAVSLPAHA